MPKIKANPDDIYSLLGFAITHAQSVEQQIRFCTTFVLQRKGPLTYEKLVAQEAEEEKKTLGYFFEQIRRRANLHPGLNKAIDEYLSMRNDLVHDTSRIPGWDLGSAEGIEVANKYLWNFIRRGGRLMEVFAALTLEWEEQVGYSTSQDSENPEFFSSLREKYAHLIPGLFGHRGSD